MLRFSEITDEGALMSRPPAAEHPTGTAEETASAAPLQAPAGLQPSASYSFTVRIHMPQRPGSFGRVATAIGETGAILGAIDLVRVEADAVVRDVTVACVDASHGERVVGVLRALGELKVDSVSDRTFLMHKGGKIEVNSKVPVKTRDDLSMAYTPGVARVCSAISEDHAKAWALTIKGGTVAVVSDGTAVLGLGDIGPEAAMPVMEGKAMLFKEFAGVDAFPLCIATKDVDEIVAFVKAAAPTFGGINLEDISAPRCFEIERRLRAELDIPVFHDDQHGTAVVVLAALINALRVVGKRAEDVKVVIVGAGAAGIACTDIILAQGVRNVVVCDRRGAIYRQRPGLDVERTSLAERTNPEQERGSADEVLDSADVFIGVSGPGAVSRRRSARWRSERSCSPWPIRHRRSSPRTSESTSRSWPPAGRTTPTRSTTSWPSPGSSAALWTCALARSTRR